MDSGLESISQIILSYDLPKICSVLKYIQLDVLAKSD